MGAMNTDKIFIFQTVKNIPVRMRRPVQPA